jgi:hypothetical protein
MSTACVVVAGVMHCIISQTPPVTAAEAAAILKPHEYVYIETNDGPNWFSSLQEEPTPGPWQFPTPAPARRLDGTLISDPPALYGPQIAPFFFNGQRNDRKRTSGVQHRQTR